MPFPTARERREALLCLIYLRGGSRYEMRSIDTYEPLADFFGLTQVERHRPRNDRNLGRKNRSEWHLAIQNTRKSLANSKTRKWIDGSNYATWRLTQPAGVEQAKRFLGRNPDLYRVRPTINIEDQDLSDDELDQAIRTNRLLIGVVPTDTKEARARRKKGRERIHKLTVENYGNRCAVCDVADPVLLTASHIFRWCDAPQHAGDLSNVICLCRMHDALFEFGYWSLGDSLELFKKRDVPSKTIRVLLDEMSSFRPPIQYSPLRQFVMEHRKRTGFLAQQ